MEFSRSALVVDDSMLIRHTVCRFLEERGYRVQSATNGAEALEALRTFRPGVIITDMQMPKMSGRELITALKSDETLATIPVIVLAARAFHAVTEPGAIAVVFKDIDIEAQLERALGSLTPAS